VCFKDLICVESLIHHHSQVAAILTNVRARSSNGKVQFRSHHCHEIRENRHLHLSLRLKLSLRPRHLRSVGSLRGTTDTVESVYPSVCLAGKRKQRYNPLFVLPFSCYGTGLTCSVITPSRILMQRVLDVKNAESLVATRFFLPNMRKADREQNHKVKLRQ